MAGCSNPCDVGTMVINPWSNPKLTIGEAMDIHIKEARARVDSLCVRKAKLEAMDWLKLPYQEVRNLLENSPY